MLSLTNIASHGNFFTYLLKEKIEFFDYFPFPKHNRWWIWR